MNNIQLELEVKALRAELDSLKSSLAKFFDSAMDFDSRTGNSWRRIVKEAAGVQEPTSREIVQDYINIKPEEPQQLMSYRDILAQAKEHGVRVPETAAEAYQIIKAAQADLKKGNDNVS